MGDKFKLPDFKSKIPNFQQQAERTMKKVMDTSNIPDFMSIASQKMAFLKKQVEDPDIEEINKFIEKLDTAKNISSVAKALGVSLEAEQVQQVIDKKNALESAIGERAFSAVSIFMEKEGYHVDNPEKIMTNVANRLQKNDDPLEVLKDTVAPFTQLAKDTLNGSHSISLSSLNVDLSGAKEKVIQKATEILSDESTMQKVKSAEEKMRTATANVDSIKLPSIDILTDKIESEINSKISNIKINTNVPEHIQKLIDKYKITGGN